ncbi:ATP-binding cassette domain-containing protein [bacterium]|nr:ATP-binding cassette domain-containing protein [bacterium]
MPLISIEQISIGFRGPSLLDDVSAVIESNQKIGLLGRNGAGKTTLMRMLTGEIQPDQGVINSIPGLKVARLVQDVPRNVTGTIREVVLASQEKSEANISDWDAETWEVEHAVDRTLSKMELDPELEFSTLSSGMKRRVLLAAAISREPDVLLLDEPTNHLDIPAIIWLEKFLKRWNGTIIFVTHDRSFLQSLATRIWEIDRGRLFDWSCNYPTFLERKEQALAAEEKQNALFDKRLAQEEVWIRQGIKARRTRNEGRVRALKVMRVERQERRAKVGKAKLKIQEAARTGALVADLADVSFQYDDQPIVKDFSAMLMRGDKIGIVGPNGAGKTTLLKLLLGQLTPDSGTVKLGTNLQVAYFDQLRDTLDPEKTVQENVGEGSDKIHVGGSTKHILGYLQDFLFSPERARTAVKYLSGGERNRALLAKLMTKPANVIVLDEPTNDLDSETLELLEEQLVSFDGTLLIVSHDRTFLNHVVTSTFVFEEGNVNEYVGGYDDWQAAVQRRERATDSTKDLSTDPKARSTTANTSSDDLIRKMSYKEKRELEELPKRIEKLEADVASLHDVMSDPSYYQQPSKTLTEHAAKLKALEDSLSKAYTRWEELESHE